MFRNNTIKVKNKTKKSTHIIGVSNNENGLSIFAFLIHTVLIIFGWWLYFIFLWEMVETQSELMLFVGVLILIFGIIIPVITSLWIRHNMNIYKKKGPRGPVKVTEEKLTADLGDIKIIADWSELKKASSMRIITNKTKKIITAE